MRPTLLTLGPFQVSSYPVMICLGACLSIWLSLKEVDRLGLESPLYLKICLIAFVSGLVGARIMNCIVFYDLYRGRPWWRMLALWEGGLAMYGGILLAVASVYAYIRHRGLSFWQVADTLFPPWMLLLILGRVGCFLNGCCYGEPTSVPWALNFKRTGGVRGFYVTRHPTQLYSAAAATVIFLIMWRIRKKPGFRGQVALVFLLLYPITRFFIEYFRADPRGMWRFFDLFTLSESQIVSIPVFLFALVAWVFLSRRSGGATAGREDPSCPQPEKCI
jgi:phosphatidylglycerol---prolipoprotein diacylglyceryl transferase